MDLSKIKTVAKHKNIPIKSVSEAIGMSPTNLHRCIRDNKISANDIEKIALYLEIPIWEFFDDKVRGQKNEKSAASDKQTAQLNKEARQIAKELEELRKMYNDTRTLSEFRNDKIKQLVLNFTEIFTEIGAENIEAKLELLMVSFINLASLHVQDLPKSVQVKFEELRNHFQNI